jgi:hypothetical protein
MKYATILLLILMASPASAEDCSAYPPGPQRFACASAHHPGLVVKRDRCKQEAENMGLTPNKQHPAVKDYVTACMQRGH